MRLTDNPRRDIPLCAGIVLLLSLLFQPACGCGERNARSTACLSNLKQQAVGLIEYEGDHDDHHPLRYGGRNNVAYSDGHAKSRKVP